MIRKLRFLVLVMMVSSAVVAAPRNEGARPETGDTDWRRPALERMRVAAAAELIRKPAELEAYLKAGLNTLVVYDVIGLNESGTAWLFKTAEQIEDETRFAREKKLPLVLGIATEPYVAALSKTAGYSLSPLAVRGGRSTDGLVANGTIPQATDSEIRARLDLWKQYGDVVVVGIYPWYDDVFWHEVDVDRQRHVYRLIKEKVPEWYVFGMIGDFGFAADEGAIARLFDPKAFDHLIVLMYPYNVGQRVTNFPLDNVASSDPDGDMVRYVDRFLARMDEKFFRHMPAEQLILLVGQAFYYEGEPAGHIPRGKDITIMMVRGNESIRRLPGQARNRSAGYYYWGVAGSGIVGLSQREDWLHAARDVQVRLAGRGILTVTE